jgi:hypothetical protein
MKYIKLSKRLRNELKYIKLNKRLRKELFLYYTIFNTALFGFSIDVHEKYIARHDFKVTIDQFVEKADPLINKKIIKFGLPGISLSYHLQYKNDSKYNFLYKRR